MPIYLFYSLSKKKLKKLLKHSFTRREIDIIEKSLKEINLLTFKQFSQNLRLIDKLKLKAGKNKKIKSLSY